MEEEELEEGELSDDEGGDARKERLKPQPVCRFYSKGQCTWGNRDELYKNRSSRKTDSQ